VRVGRLGDLRHLGHQRFVDELPASGVEQHHVMAAETRRLKRPVGDLDRRLAGDDGQRVGAGLLAQHLELFLRGRPPGVERRHQYAPLLLFGEALGDLGRGRRLARALEADHHDGNRHRRVQIDGRGFSAQRLDQSVVDDLHDHLAGSDRLDDVGADRARAQLLGELAHHLEGHVGLEQRPTHLAERRGDIGLRQRAAPGQLVEDAGKAVLEALEHVVTQAARSRGIRLTKRRSHPRANAR
jgi:hypothetical protein